MRRLSGVSTGWRDPDAAGVFAERRRAAGAGPTEAHDRRRHRARGRVAIKPDKTADYEQILAKVKEALTKSDDARGQAAAGRLEGRQECRSRMPDGNIIYIHVINPVVRAPTTTILQIALRGLHGPDRAEGALRPVSRRVRGNLGISADASPSTSRSKLRDRAARTIVEPRAAARRSWLFVVGELDRASSRLLRRGRPADACGCASAAGAVTPAAASRSAAPAPAPPAGAAPPAPAAPGRCRRRRAAAAARRADVHGAGGLIFNTVRPERVVDFETVHRLPAGALEKSTDPTVRRRRGLARVQGDRARARTARVLYVFVIDPAVPGADYGLGRDPGRRVSRIRSSRRSGSCIRARVTGGGSLLNLTPVDAAAAPPARPRRLARRRRLRPDAAVQCRATPSDATPDRGSCAGELRTPDSTPA